MTNWSNPISTSLYTDLINDLKGRDEDLAKMFNPDNTASTNIAVGTIRWNPTSDIWEIRNASSGWDPLAAAYNINVDRLGGQQGAYYLAWANQTGKPTTFTPSAHNHDSIYYTETEADARFGFSLDALGNNIRMKAPDGTILGTITPPYATSAGNAGTVNGKNVDQNLRTTDTVSFAGLSTTSDINIKGDLNVGKIGGGASNIHFYDDNSSTWRTLRWDNTLDDWTLEDNSGVMRKIFHEGHVPTWGEISGKPSTFTAAAHGHTFDNINQMTIRKASTAVNASLTGLQGELVYNTDTGRIHSHNGSAAGGLEHALKTDITGVSIIAGTGLTGGGDLSTNRTLTLSFSSQAEAEAGANNNKSMTALRVSQAITKRAPEVYAQTDVIATTTTTINFSTSANHQVTLGMNTILVFSNKAANIGKSGVIALVQDVTGGRTITFPTEIQLPHGSASIVQDKTANSTAILSYYILDATTVLVNYIGGYT